MEKLVLKSKQGTFTNGKGEAIIYVQFYVELNGLELYLTPKDDTSKQILKAHYQSIQENLKR